MLATNIVEFKSNLNKLLSTPPSAGPVYKAAYDAYYSISNFDINTDVDDIDIKPILEKTKQQCESKRKNDADLFAKTFCENLLKSDIMNDIADEIDKHIKSALIDISIPVIPPTLISPSGPVTGSLLISETAGANISIQ